MACITDNAMLGQHIPRCMWIRVLLSFFADEAILCCPYRQYRAVYGQCLSQQTLEWMDGHLEGWVDTREYGDLAPAKMVWFLGIFSPFRICLLRWSAARTMLCSPQDQGGMDRGKDAWWGARVQHWWSLKSLQGRHHVHFHMMAVTLETFPGYSTDGLHCTARCSTWPQLAAARLRILMNTDWILLLGIYAGPLWARLPDPGKDSSS